MSDFYKPYSLLASYNNLSIAELSFLEDNLKRNLAFMQHNKHKFDQNTWGNLMEGHRHQLTVLENIRRLHHLADSTSSDRVPPTIPTQGPERWEQQFTVNNLHPPNFILYPQNKFKGRDFDR